MFTLTAAVAMVLLVVCANVANLMLARAAARGREISVRIALGAGRMRLVQQLLTESAVLAIIGSACGLVVAWWGSTAILRLAAGGPRPVPVDVRLDWPVVAFTLGLSITTTLLIGLVPALRATRSDVASALRTQGRDSGAETTRRGRIPLGKGLVIAQMALSMLLLVGTGMLVRSTERLAHADVGIARDQLILADVAAQQSGYTDARMNALVRDLMARAAAIPGIAAVSVSENGIFSGTESATNVQVEGFTARVDSDTAVKYDDVGAGYFNAVGAHLLRGRGIEARDNETGPRVAVINETMARFYFPHGDALGRHITADSTVWEIVGIVADARTNDVRETPDRRLFVPIVQMKHSPDQFRVELRTGGDPARLVDAVRRALLASDPSLVVTDVSALPALIQDSLTRGLPGCQGGEFLRGNRAHPVRAGPLWHHGIRDFPPHGRVRTPNGTRRGAGRRDPDGSERGDDPRGLGDRPRVAGRRRGVTTHSRAALPHRRVRSAVDRDRRHCPRDQRGARRVPARAPRVVRRATGGDPRELAARQTSQHATGQWLSIV